MMATTHPLESTLLDTVDVVDGTLYIRELVVTDDDVARVVGEADDPVEGTRQCLRIGAQAIRAVSATFDTNVVERRFDSMSDRFDTRVEQVVDQIADTARALLDEEDGSLTTTLAAHRDQLELLLGSTFDPNSKQSVLGIFEAVLTDSHEKQAAALRKLVAIEGDDSPLARLKVEIGRELRDQLVGVRDEVQALSEKIAVTAATADVFELTTQKGFVYEDAVHVAVARIASAHGDQADKVGTELGVAGTQKGDEVVTLSREDTFGSEGCFVIEAKHQKLNTRKTNEELEAALENRDALAAVAVFSSADQAPSPVPFTYTDNKAIAVFDPTDGDDSALRLAYMWARWVVRRELTGTDADGLDVERIASLLGDATRGLERVSQIKGFHTKARKNIDQAEQHALALADEVGDALAQIEAELG